MSDIMPVHVRATWVAREGRSLILRRPRLRRGIVYDVRFADGTVHHEVHLSTVLQGARFPADYSAVVRGAEAVAGDGTPGVWVDYPYGRPLPE